MGEARGSTAWLDYADAALGRLLSLARRSQDGEADDAGTEGGPDADAELDAARDRFHKSLHDEASGFGAMAANAGLSEPECEVLAFAVACELDSRRQQLVAYLQDDVGSSSISFQTIGRLLGGLDRCPSVIGPQSRLRRAALVDVTDDGPWAQQRIVVPTSLVWAFLGDTSPDPGLPLGTRVLETDESGGDDLLVVVGPDRVRRRDAAMAATVGSGFLVVPGSMGAEGWAAVVREATMTGLGVVIELEGELPADGRRWIERADHLAWAITSAIEIPIADLPDRPWRELDAPAGELTPAEWADAFGDDTPHTHRLSPQQLEQVRRVYGARGHDIDAAVRRLLAGPLESLAQRVRPRRSWDDIVLAPARLAQLHSIIARYRHASRVYDEWGFSAIPSRGLVSMFSGPSGTGKTLAAEIVASELGLDMFKLDLSSVVSKYIGETEKNLDRIFDAAGVGNVVLFFDEADAIFGKRSEVKDSRDRYANLEVSYLLQRVEAFDGVVVLATNFAKSIDDAFSRRIHVQVDFALPERSEREAIWRRHLPEGAPLEDVDLGWLATHLELSGGQIRNAAVQAAFTAADAGAAITMASMVRAAATELRKAGRLLQPADFGEWYGAVST